METEVKTPETDNTQPEVKATTPSAPAQTTEETQEQINWRKFREAREVERKQKNEAEKRASEKEAEAAALKAALEAIVNRPAPSNNYQTSEETEETEEQRIKRLVAETLEVERKKDQIEREKKDHAEFPQKLASTYKDFDKVCTSDNLDYLEYHYPEVANAFKRLPDGYDKWSDIYHAVKRFVPNTESKKEQAKADKNFSKPQAMSIPGKTQTGDTAPHSLDDKRKKDNWTRMQKVMRGG
jgi:hypothetical protein